MEEKMKKNEIKWKNGRKWKKIEVIIKKNKRKWENGRKMEEKRMKKCKI